MKFYSKLIVIVMLFATFWVPPIDAAQKLILILDWFPNIDHLPIYAARQQGLFTEEGLEIKIISPSDTADGLKMAASGNVDIAVVILSNLALFIAMFTRKRRTLDRAEGAFLLLLYACYIGYVVNRG